MRTRHNPPSLRSQTLIPAYDIPEQGLQLNRLRQLTGLSDPVYAEAYVQVHVYDIVLDVLVINQVKRKLVSVFFDCVPTDPIIVCRCRRPTRYKTYAWNWQR